MIAPLPAGPWRASSASHSSVAGGGRRRDRRGCCGHAGACGVRQGGPLDGSGSPWSVRRAREGNGPGVGVEHAGGATGWALACPGACRRARLASGRACGPEMLDVRSGGPLGWAGWPCVLEGGNRVPSLGARVQRGRALGWWAGSAVLPAWAAVQLGGAVGVPGWPRASRATAGRGPLRSSVVDGSPSPARSTICPASGRCWALAAGAGARRAIAGAPNTRSGGQRQRAYAPSGGLRGKVGVGVSAASGLLGVARSTAAARPDPLRRRSGWPQPLAGPWVGGSPEPFGDSEGLEAQETRPGLGAAIPELPPLLCPGPGGVYVEGGLSAGPGCRRAARGHRGIGGRRRPGR